MSALESATDSWTNVNVQTYTAGTTSFGGNSNTGCTTTICNNNKYSMRERSARARLVTVPEAWAVGCGTGAQNTCPKYMHNYLKNADEYEAIVDGGEISVVYWTMSAYSHDSGVAWDVAYFGNVNLAVLTGHGGGRAVVEINK